MEQISSTTLSSTTISSLSSTVSSFNERHGNYFAWYDYTIFATLLGFSMSIGIYFGCFQQKKQTATDYLMGGKTMKVIPVVISLVASHSSGVTLLAVPADVYVFGAGYILVTASILITVAITNCITLPVFHKLQLTSTYEYLGLRFDNKARKLSSVLFMVSIILHLPVSIFIPALAFGAASGLNVNYIVPVICGICITYTSIGGIKGLVWTDTIQFSLTFGVMSFFLFFGIAESGGFANMWKENYESGRLDIFNMRSGFNDRESFWAIIIGFIFAWSAHNSFNQGCNQKFLAVPTLKQSKRVVAGYSIGMAIVKTFSVTSGLILAARYAKCDPFVTHQVERNDQLLPFYILQITRNIPCLSGMFIAGVFNAGLSHLSANLNALSGAFYEDFLRVHLNKKGIKNDGLILKILVVFFGVLCTSLVYVIQNMGGILSLAVGLGGVAYGPLVGMFLLGMLVPRANAKGAFYGAMTAMLCMGTIIYGSNYYKSTKVLRFPHKPISVEACDFFVNKTVVEDQIHSLLTGSGEDVFFLFRMSFYWYGAVGTAITIVVGLIVSYMTESRKVPKKLLSPIIYPLLGDDYKEEDEYCGVEEALQRVGGERRDADKTEDKKEDILRKMSYVSDTFDN